jgi:hypothetical protein
MTSKTRNKPYKQKIKNPNPLSPYLTQVELAGLKRIGQLALRKMMEGKGSQQDWCDLVCRLIVGRQVVMTHFNEVEVAGYLHHSIARLVQIYNFEGAKQPGSWELPMMDAERIKEALDNVDDLLTQITRKEYVVIYEPVSRIMINKLVSEDCTWEEYLKRQNSK